MVDDEDDGRRRKRMLDDRTAPVPPHVGHTQSADTLEAGPASFADEAQLVATSGEPPPAARSTPERVHDEETHHGSFDDEVERRGLRPTRPATAVRRSPLTAIDPALTAPELKVSASSDPSPSSVFTSPGTHIAERAAARPDSVELDDVSGSAPTAPIDPPTLPLTLSSDVHEMSSESAIVTDPEAQAPPDVSESGTTLETPAPPPVSAVLEQSAFARPETRLPDRIDPAERERLANDETRIRAERKKPSGKKRGLGTLLVLAAIGAAAATAGVAYRSSVAARASTAAATATTVAVQPTPPPAAATTPVIPSPPPPPVATPEAVSAAAQIDAQPTPAPSAATTDAARDATASAATSAPSDETPTRDDAAATRPPAARAGFHDLSGSRTIGLAQALAAGVRPATKAAKAAGFAVRGEVRRAGITDGEAVLDCSVTLLEAKVRRVTLQASARANDAGQRPDRLLRLAAERCGQSLAPDVEQALTRVAQR